MREDLKSKKIIILAGGWSDEREISLISGRSVFNALKNAGYNVKFCDFTSDEFTKIESYFNHNKSDILFNLMHGKGGEDGKVQTYLDKLGLFYVGSNAEASHLSFNKVLTKERWIKNGLPTPKFKDLHLVDEKFLKDLHNINKIIIKPKSSGSSVGIKIIVIDNSDIINQEIFINKIKNIYGDIDFDEYFIELFVDGSEYTTPILNGKVLPVIKIETKREFYDYDAKYNDENTRFTFPTFEKRLQDKINKTCLDAFESLGCTGWGRVDFFLDANMSINLIELNSIPGMTNHSLVPMSADKFGYSYLELIENILTQKNV